MSDTSDTSDNSVEEEAVRSRIEQANGECDFLKLPPGESSQPPS